MENKGKGLAIAALVLGICALVFCWVSVVNFILAALAVVFGIIALVKKATKGMALTGLILGAVALIISIIVNCFWGIALLGAASEYGTNSSSSYYDLYY